MFTVTPWYMVPIIWMPIALGLLARSVQQQKGQEWSTALGRSGACFLLGNFIWTVRCLFLYGQIKAGADRRNRCSSTGCTASFSTSTTTSRTTGSRSRSTSSSTASTTTFPYAHSYFGRPLAATAR